MGVHVTVNCVFVNTRIDDEDPINVVGKYIDSTGAMLTRVDEYGFTVMCENHSGVDILHQKLVGPNDDFSVLNKKDVSETEVEIMLHVKRNEGIFDRLKSFNKSLDKPSR